MIQEILNKIEEYQYICIYRHVNPDLDAFGSQFGMKEIIETSYPDKKVYIEGIMTSDLVEKMKLPKCNEKPDFSLPVLAIVLDTANKERIDGESIKDCKEIIKIDHHIVIDQYGDINYEIPEASSCSEIVALMLEHEKVSITKEGANYLYMGIIGDSNRFYYSSTSSNTFKAASLLLQQGINIQELYESMYLKDANDLKVQGFILSNFIDEGNIAYYILKDEDLNHLGITRERGSDFVNLLSSVKQFEVWIAFTENKKDNNWRVSMRSRHVPVNTVANKYKGGGHACAAGATLQSFDQIKDIVEDLKGEIYEFYSNKH